MKSSSIVVLNIQATAIGFGSLHAVGSKENYRCAEMIRRELIQIDKREFTYSPVMGLGGTFTFNGRSGGVATAPSFSFSLVVKRTWYRSASDAVELS
jgi:hypothetical protein